MKTVLPGVSGSLFPSQFLARGPLAGDGVPNDDARTTQGRERERRQFEGWWARVALTCGPATSIRQLFDLVAMPLVAALGFRAREVTFDRMQARVRLDTPSRTPVALVLLPWAVRPSTMWRDVVALARSLDAEWGLVLTPPFLSVVDTRGHAVRRAVDFRLPQALDARSFGAFWSLTRARVFDSRSHDTRDVLRTPIDDLVSAARQFEDRMRGDLQHGVIEALTTLAGALRLQASGRGDEERFGEALTIVYRILFLLFAESRDLVPHHHPVYREAYTVGTLCDEAIGAQPARGLWDALGAITRLSRVGCRADDLIVRPFNGRLFAAGAAPSLEARGRSRRPARDDGMRDAALQRALVALASRAGSAGRETISYADLGVEQLGAVYERVLDLDPAQISGAGIPRAPSRHSARRKESGTFYTPQALCEFVVRRTLAPLVASASADAILSLRVVDPAMGSGAFLVAACRYLAGAYEHALIEEGRWSAADIDETARANIRRLIAERCLAGVDANPVAVQLARLSLWLATLAEGKPLGFLDHRLRVGNSLIGIFPEDLWRVPKRRSGERRSTALPLFDSAAFEDTVRRVVTPLADLTRRRDDTVEDVHAKASVWAALTGDSSPLRPWRLAANLWCARRFWPDAGGESAPAAPEIRAALDAILRGDPTLRPAYMSRLLTMTAAIEKEQTFFHWPLEFADAFYDAHGRPRDRPGFDAVIGNPPWEMLRRDPDAQARDGRRPALVRFIRESGLYRSCERGHVNLYQPFLERALMLTRAGGRVGLILPWGLAVDDGASALRARLLDQTSIDALVGLDNGQGLFPIHRGLRFLAVVAGAPGPTREIRARFGVRAAPELGESA